MIKDSFIGYEIKKYFDSHMRLGSLGHALTGEEKKVFIVSLPHSLVQFFGGPSILLTL